MLRELHLSGIGSATKFDLEFAPRLNVLTGDNGLGKSFVLDVAWWCAFHST
jgi:DNA repair ATPase RecN